MSFDVIGLGCACLDMLCVLPHMPEIDDEVQMTESLQQGGGEVATALVTLAKLGASTAYLGKIGDDPAGYAIRQEFDQYGVHTDHIIMEPGAQSIVSVIMVDQSSGMRTILAGKTTVSPYQPDEVPAGLIEQTRFLHLDHNFRQAAQEAARRARQAGIKVVLDADILAYDEDIAPLIQLTDILIPSLGFTKRFTGTEDPEKAIEIMKTYGPSVIALTLGDQGSVCYADDRYFHTPAFPVEVVDTTGAGDVFHGAFILGLLQNWSLEKTAEFASAVAAMKCRKLGGRQGIPTWDEALTFLKDRKALYF